MEKINGIDLRCKKKDELIVVQVKHYKEINLLLSKLKNEELEKVTRINPDRYILVTSVDLTPKRKEDIINIFEGYIKNPGDILGRAELNSLLEKPEYRFVEEEFYELWLNSTNILKDIIQKELNRDIYVRTKFALEEIKKSTKIYVKNESFEQAINKIKKKKCILICGEPEVGKTTLARNLIAYLINKNRKTQFIYAQNVNEVFKCFKEDKQQLFFIDDFWGSRFDGNLRGNEENELKTLIEIVENSNNKILILTSREYILQQGYAEFPNLEEFFDEYKLYLSVSNYTDLFKARILFRHLQNSKLDNEIICELAQGYEYIIEDDNYSPRIIENFINYIQNKENKCDNYLNEFILYLRHPHKIWKDIFAKQNEGAQLIAVLMLLWGEYIELDDIKKLFFACLDSNIRINARKKEFSNYISQLENTIITTYEDEFACETKIFVKFKNSSIESYIFKYFNENLEEYASDIINNTTCLNNLLYLSGYWQFVGSCELNVLKKEKVNYNITKELIELIDEKILKDFDKLSYKEDLDCGVIYKEESNQCADKLICLIRYYDEYKNENLRKFIIEKVKWVISELKAIKVSYDDTFSIPALIYNSIKYNIYSEFDATEIISSFWESIRFSRQFLYFYEFKDIFPIQYNNFINDKDIKNIVKNMILKDAKRFAEFGWHNCLKELTWITIPDLFSFYRIICDESYVDEFYKVTGIVLDLEEVNWFLKTEEIDYESIKTEKDYEKECERKTIEKEMNELINEKNLK